MPRHARPPEPEDIAARRAFVRRKVRSDLPYAVAADMSMLVLAVADGARLGRLLFTAAVATASLALIWLPLAVVAARCEWRRSLLVERRL